jgi:hypothetical protein
MASQQTAQEMLSEQQRQRVEGMLMQMSKKAQGDQDYEQIEMIAKQYGVRPPWHPDFNGGRELPQDKPEQAQPPTNIFQKPMRLGGPAEPHPDDAQQDADQDAEMEQQGAQPVAKRGGSMRPPMKLGGPTDDEAQDADQDDEQDMRRADAMQDDYDDDEGTGAYQRMLAEKRKGKMQERGLLRGLERR